MKGASVFESPTQRVLLFIVAAAAFLSYPVAEASREQLCQEDVGTPLVQDLAPPTGEPLSLVSPFVQDEVVFQSSPGFKALLAAADEADTVRARALLRHGCERVDAIELVMVPAAGKDAAREVRLERAGYTTEASASSISTSGGQGDEAEVTGPPPEGTVPCPVTLTVPRIPVSETTRGWLIAVAPDLDAPSTSESARSTDPPQPTGGTTDPAADTGTSTTDPPADMGEERPLAATVEQAKTMVIPYRIVRVIGWEGHALLVVSAIIVTSMAALTFSCAQGNEGSSRAQANLKALPVVTGAVAVFAAISSGSLAWSELAPDLHLGSILVIALASALLVAISKATEGKLAFALGVTGLALIALIVPLALLHGATTKWGWALILWSLLVLGLGAAVGWAAAQPGDGGQGEDQ